MKSFWQDKKVLVTGGTGFIGSYVTEQLLEKGAIVSVSSKSDNNQNIKHVEKNIKIVRADLRDPEQALKATKNQEVILHLASKVAGIQFNFNHPATMFSDNVLITKNILDAAVKSSIERILITSSACVYPRHCTVPTPETEGFKDDPEPTNLGYGWSKRISELMGKFYASEFNLKVAIARPYNAYGPRDDLDPSTSHVIPGLIKRIFDGEKPLMVWGSGNQTRSFIYAEDLARGLIATTEKYALAEPVNIGSHEEISIADLATLLIKLSEKKTKIQFDHSKPDGQPRRCCDITKAKQEFGFEATIPLEEGLKRTILWYKQH